MHFWEFLEKLHQMDVHSLVLKTDVDQVKHIMH